MITNLIWILIVFFVAMLFWQQRKQSENARRYIEARCDRLDLQLISIARADHKVAWLTSVFSITTRYYFEFSNDGVSCYQGYLLMKGIAPQTLYMPPYPI